MFVDLTNVVAISTFALLFYYSIVNLSAFKLIVNGKRQRFLPLLGLATCLILLAFILLEPTQRGAWLVGVVFLLPGTVFYTLRKKLTR